MILTQTKCVAFSFWFLFFGLWFCFLGMIVVMDMDVTV